METSLSQSRYPDSRNPKSVNDGLRYEDFVVRECLKHGIIIQLHRSAFYQLNHGESVNGYEIKLDARCTDTGRLSIEIGERSSLDRIDFVASGIYAPQKPTFYVQGNYTCFWMFDTNVLITYHRMFVRNRGKKNGEWDEIDTIRKFYMSLQHANENCIRRFVVSPDGQYAIVEKRQEAAA